MLRPIQSQSVNHSLSLVFITVCAWITSVYTSAACGSSNYRAVSLQTSSKNMPLYNQSISSYLDIRSASMNMWRSIGTRLTGGEEAVETLSYDLMIQPHCWASSTTDKSVSFRGDDRRCSRSTTYNSGWTPNDRSPDQLLIVFRWIRRRSGDSLNVVNSVSSRRPSRCRRLHRLPPVVALLAVGRQEILFY